MIYKFVRLIVTHFLKVAAIDLKAKVKYPLD